MSHLIRRRFSIPLTFVLIWGLVVQPVLPVQAQPTNPTPPGARSPDLNGVWLIAEGKQCTPLGDRVEMAGKIRIEVTTSDALGVEVTGHLVFCDSFLYFGKYQGRNLEAIDYNRAGPVRFQGIVSQDGHRIEGEEIDEQTGARTRFVWQREIPDVADALKTDDDVEPLKIDYLAKYRDFERGGAEDSGPETPISIVVDPAPLGKTAGDTSATAGASFPGAEKPSNVKNSRTLFVYGRNLKKEPNRPVSIESLNDRNIGYTVLDPEARGGSDADKAEMLSAIEVGQKKAQEHMSPEQKEAFKKMDQILVRADFRGTVLPDFKEFKLSDRVGRWFLIYGSTKAEINIVRHTGGRTPQGKEETEKTDFIFSPERVMLEVETDREFKPDLLELIRRRPESLGENKIRLTLLRNGSLVESGGRPLVLEASPVPGSNNLYRTQPFDMLLEGAPGESPVRAKHGDRFAPRLAEDQDRWLFFTPTLARVFVPDAAQGTAWQRALRKADADFPADESGVRLPSGILISHPLREKLAAIRRNPGAREITLDVVYEKYPLQEGKDRRLYAQAQVQLGHVAAMYALKSAFLDMMDSYDGELAKIKAQIEGFDENVLYLYLSNPDGEASINAADLQKLKFLRGLRDLITPILVTDNTFRPNFPLTNLPVRNHVRDPNRPKIPLHEAIFSALKNTCFSSLAADSQVSFFFPRPCKQDLVWEEYSFLVVREALEEYRKTVSDAHQKASETTKLLPLLGLTGVNFRPVVERVRPRLMKFDPASGRWVPDVVARQWVARIESLADEFEAQKKIDEAKAQIFVLAIGLVPFAASGSLLLRITANAIAAGDVAAYMVPAYIRQNEEVKFALGAQGLLGPERLRVAEAQRTPQWALILAVGGAGLGIVADLAEVLVVAGAAERAGQALAKIKDKGLRAFKELPVEEQTAILKKGADGAAKAARGEAVDGTERAATALVAKHADEAIAASGAGARTARGTTLPRGPAAPVEEIRSAKTAIEAELSIAESKLRTLEGGANKLAAKEAKDIVGELKIRKEILDDALKTDAPDLAQLRQLSADDLEFLKSPTLSPERRAAAHKLLLEDYNGWKELKHAFNEDKVRKVDMLKVGKYRDEVVDKYLEDVLKEVSTKGGLEREAVGSTDLTSDYDISIKGDGAELVVIKFNEKFRLDPRFKGLESGTVFDTNIYTDPVYNLFKGKTPGGFALELDPLQLDDLRQFMYDQMATRKYLTDAEWGQHFNRMIAGAPSEDMRKVVRYAMEEAERGHISAQRLIAKRLDKLGIRPPAVLDDNSLLRATNDINGDILLDIHKLKEEVKRIGKLGLESKLEDFIADPRVVELLGERDYNSILRRIEGLIGTERPEAQSVIDTLKARLQEMISQQARNKQGVALYFASEAYQADGTIAHVVGELQKGGWGSKITKKSLLSAPRESKLTRGQYLDSFFENRANMFKELEHARNPATGAFDDARYAAAKGAKYFIRKLDAANQAGIGLRGLVDEDIIELTVNIAKDKGKLEVVADLLKGKNITGEKFIEAVEKASNKLRVEALSKSPLQEKAGLIAQYWRDMDPELARYAERPRPFGGGGAKPGDEGPTPPRPPTDPEPPRPTTGPDRPPEPDDIATAPDPPRPPSGEPPPRPKPSAETPSAPRVGEVIEEAGGQRFLIGKGGQRLPIGEKIGEGLYTTVYELRDGTNRVVKVYRRPEGGTHTIQQVMNDIKNGSDLLERHRIPQAKTFWQESVLEGDLPFIVQERIQPAGRFANNFEDRMGRAVAKLYRKFADKNIVWEDGHINNIFFKEEGGELIAGVFDVDNITEWDRMSERLGARLADYEYSPSRKGINSLPGFLRPGMIPDANAHLFPSAEFFMLKMFEAKGWIEYVPGRAGEPGRFVKRLIDPEMIQKDFFPNLYRDSGPGAGRSSNLPREERSIPFPRHSKRPTQFFPGAHPVFVRQALAA